MLDFIQNFLQCLKSLFMKGFDQNLDKYFGQLTVVGFYKSPLDKKTRLFFLRNPKTRLNISLSNAKPHIGGKETSQ